MPTTTISSDIITSDAIAVDLVPSEDLELLFGVRIESSNVFGVGIRAATGGAHDITVRGTIDANNGILYEDGSFGSVNITGAGTISGGEIAVYVRGTSTGTFNLTNAGTLSGNTTGIAVVFDGRFVGTNSGTITSVAGDAVAIGVRNGGTFTNDGLIETSAIDANAVDLFHTGTGGTPVTFINNGTIRSNGDDALDMDSNDPNRALNFGTIDGSVVLGDKDDFFRQAGILMGDIVMGDGADRFSGGTGQTLGTVYAGTGDDKVVGGSTGDVLEGEGGNDWMRGNNGRDSIYGGFGRDTLRGDTFNDDLYGGGGADEMRGGSGGDLMYGGSEADLMFGQSGRDEMYGGTGNDTMSGGSFKDTLYGGDGNDVIDGGDARDVITGGLGVDTITGGAGTDTFIWNSVLESETMATRDRVLDFGFFAEVLDFSALTGPALTYRGTNAFTGSGNAEVRVFENNFGNSMVQVDVNGDGQLDMVVQVNGQGLTVDNFIL